MSDIIEAIADHIGIEYHAYGVYTLFPSQLQTSFIIDKHNIYIITDKNNLYIKRLQQDVDEVEAIRYLNNGINLYDPLILDKAKRRYNIIKYLYYCARMVELIRDTSIVLIIIGFIQMIIKIALLIIIALVSQ
jgi:hypothetical protein